ncbi:hypothetical protein GDO81_011704 [Engystomops pustulosus]|uniref:Uncharacterized protein n=1 Tax=Engystomops pustulosus TaxID=76066 RepID=A0AAV7BG47_ENGPU|nr:hypothetical protein GDO81_011704 [Engystomops pustulosus]
MLQISLFLQISSVCLLIQTILKQLSCRQCKTFFGFDGIPLGEIHLDNITVTT